MESDIVKSLGDVGAVGLMFLAYYFLHRETFNILQSMFTNMTANFNAALQEQKKSTSDTVNSVVAAFERMSDQRRDTEERNYEVLKSLADDLKVLAASIGRVEMKVDNLESHLSTRRTASK